VTHATPVQAYGTADAPATAGRAAVARLATLSREFAPDLSVVIHDNLDAVESEVAALIDHAVELARAAPPPDTDALLRDVYVSY